MADALHEELHALCSRLRRTLREMFIEAKTFGPVVVQQNEMRILWPIRIRQPSISKAFEAVD